MRTRSSRFFVILLHLVGVSHVARFDYGIVAVLPWPVALEQVDLSIVKTTTSTKDDDDATTTGAPPVWLQDSSDGLCLGPTGTFSECGDATLWFVKSTTTVPNKLALLSGIMNFGSSSSSSKTSSTKHGYMFQLVDRDYEATGDNNNSSRNNNRQQKPQQAGKRNNNIIEWGKQKIMKPSSECLDATQTVEVQKCRKPQSVWTVNSDGVLQVHEKKKKKKKKRVQDISSNLCLAREDNKAIMVDCTTQKSDAVQFSFLRYRAVAVTVPEVRDKNNKSSSNSKTMESIEETQQHVDDETANTVPTPAPSQTITIPSSNLPVYKDLAHSQASDPAIHSEPKLGSRPHLSDSSTNKKNSKKKPTPITPFGVLADTNPILLANRRSTTTVASGKINTKNNNNNMKSFTHPPSLHNSNNNNNNFATSDFTTTSTTSKIRRIQTHPYINEAINEIWTDPQTGLEYPTDLCKYLGRDRKEHGRHTLTGFGIYRKGYVIKVYGIAFYVSKRDILATTALQQYATLTAEQLRNRPDFYNILRTNAPGHDFDRTIMLKTNMQLATDTMRSSLQADWSYLTEEMKQTLIGSSMEPRPADDTMLKIIDSTDINPSRCSCSQTAPPEYKANPDCCARGTELAFTWTKDNYLELRLNGRLVDKFPRPDIAQGIFYEYMRYDDPICPELRDHVVDGFPFLLGPLAQVKGINLGQQSSKGHSSSKSGSSNPVMHAIGSFADSMKTQAVEMAGLAKRTMVESAEHASHAMKTFGEAAIEMGKELDRKRDTMVKHTVAAPGFVAKVFMRDPDTLEAITRWMSGKHDIGEEVQEEELSIPVTQATRRIRRVPLHGRYPLSRWFGDEYYAPDEIGPMKIHPTINRIILALVHLYLLLLFIVSFPGSYSTRTKLIIRRSPCHSRDVSDDSESDTSEENAKECEDTIASLEACSSNRRLRKGDNSSRRSSRRRSRGILSRARNALSNNNNNNKQKGEDDSVNNTDGGSRIKKKSLSYFL